MSLEQEAFEFKGKNVDAAVEAGLAALGLSRSDVEVVVIHPGSRGLLGFGAEDARVRLIPHREKPAPTPPPSGESVALEKTVEEEQYERPSRPQEIEAEKPADATLRATAEGAADLLRQLLQYMGIEASVTVGFPKCKDDPIVLNVEGDDLGILIGRRGETLEALQFITRLMVNRANRRWVNLVVDVEQYRSRREQALRQFALRMADRAVSTGRTVALEAMPARERRIIHLTLRDHPHVTTQSVGEGDRRKVTIIPKH
ncbi:MAG TPA: protein jag [Anaerolineae bacterium]|nr:protein jag [Anaerolineae bacterium]